MTVLGALALPVSAQARLDGAKRARPAVSIAAIVAPEWTNTVRTVAATTIEYTCDGPQVTIFDNWNGEGVLNGATPPSFDTGSTYYCINTISTYHWNFGFGVPGPISVGLAGASGVGPWAGAGAGLGTGGFHDWTGSAPTQIVIHGAYTCQDSDTSTWSQNPTSGGKGFCKVVGRVATAIDSTPPTLDWTGPATGSSISGTTRLTAVANDDVAVARVEFYVESTPGSSSFGLVGSVPGSGGAFELLWDTLNRPNGVYAFQAVAYDTSENRAAVTVGGVRIANANPAASIHASITSDYVFVGNFTPLTSVALDIGGVARSVTTDGSGNATYQTVGINLESGMTITATDGASTKSLILEPLTFDTLNSVSEIATGTAPPLASLEIFLFDRSVQVFSSVVGANAGGAWSFTFPVDVRPGMFAMIDLADADGDRTRADLFLAQPNIHATPANDQINLYGWVRNGTVDLLIGGTPYTASTDGFGAVTIRRSDHGVDVVPGTVIDASDGIVTDHFVVGSLALDTVNIGSDTVLGSAAAGDVVTVEIHNQSGALLGTVDATADGSGRWTANFGGIVDITTLMSVNAFVPDGNGNFTHADLFLDRAEIHASITFDSIFLGRFARNATVHLSVAGVLRDVTTDDGGNAFVERSLTGVDIVPGTVVTADDGVQAKSLTLVGITFDTLNAATDTAEGTAPPGSDVQLFVNRQDGTPVTVQNPPPTARTNVDGRWTYTFSEDITLGVHGNADVSDADGDRSRAEINRPAPTMLASITSDGISFFGWPGNTDVDVRIDGAGPFSVRTDPSGQAFLNRGQHGRDIRPGVHVTAEGGGVLKSLDVTDVTFDTLDVDTNIATGTAPTGSQVQVCLSSGPAFLGCKSTTANSPWSVDFTGTVDVVPGVQGSASVRDADFDGTSAELGTPPDTTITTGPPATSTSNGDMFTFTSSTSGATFQCALDSGAYAPCTSPKVVFTANGAHAFRVRAVFNGVQDPTPASYTWISNTAPAPEGMVRIDVAGPVDTLDSARAFIPSSWQILQATCAKLVNYGDVDGASPLQPEVAQSLPLVSGDGRTYTFILRPGFSFANGLPVDAQSFADAIERSLDPATQGTPPSDPPAKFFFADIEGAQAYMDHTAGTISGLNADGYTLQITLDQPRYDFLARLATPFACPVPPGTPHIPLPLISGSGPYTVESFAPGGIGASRAVLARNPNYGGTRERHFDRLDIALNVDPAAAEQRVLQGVSDYVNNPPAGDTDSLRTNYPDQFELNPQLLLRYLALNNTRPAFSSVSLRKAVNFALDRRAIMNALVATPQGGTPTDQYLPPGMPGYRDADIYPLEGPNLDQALALASLAGVSPTSRISVEMYTCNSQPCHDSALIVQSNLAAIGIDVVIHEFPRSQQLSRQNTPGEPYDIAWEGWAADYADPFDFIGFLFKGGAATNYSHFLDPGIDTRIEDAQRTPAPLRYDLFAQLDADLAAGFAPAAAVGNTASRDLFSERIGCRTFSPVFGMNLAGLCVADTVAPVVSFTAPHSGATVSGSVALAGTIVDAGGAGDWIFEYRRQGEAAWHEAASGTGNPVQGMWDTVDLPEAPGLYELRLTGKDPSGNAGVAAIELTVHNADPDTILEVDAPAISSLDPAVPGGSTMLQVNYATCLKLVNFEDVDGKGALEKFVPEAATDLPIVSADRMTYSFSIRDGLRFSDGTALTALAFKRAFTRALALDGTSGGYSTAIFGNVASVSVDGAALTFNLNRPDEAFLAKLATPPACASPDDLPNTQTDDQPSGGPYFIASYVPGVQLILNENPHYTGDRPHNFEQIVFKLGVSQSDAVDNVAAETTDYASGGVPAPRILSLTDSYGGSGRLVQSPNLLLRSIGMNNNRPVFTSPAVRRAVALALDRSALAAQYPGTTRTDQLLPHGMPGFVDYNIYPSTITDFTAARAVVADAGFAGATVVVLVSQCRIAQGCDPVALGQAITNSLARVGLVAEIHIYPNVGDWLGVVNGNGWDLTTFGWVADYPDPAGSLDVLVDPTAINSFDFTHFDVPFQLNRLRGTSSIPPGPGRYAEYSKQDLEISRDYAPLTGFASGNNYDFYSSRMGCQISNPFFGVDLAALCLKVTVESLTLTAGAAAAEAGAASVDPADIPVDSIPLQNLAQVSTPLSQVLIGSPLSQVPLSQVGLSGASSVLASLLLSQIPLVGRSWTQVLAGTSLAGVPIQNVTFTQAQAAAPAAVGAIALGEIDLSASPLSQVGLAALALGNTPLSQVPLSQVGTALEQWCAALAGPPINCVTASSLSTDTVVSVALRGAPLSQVPLSQVPLSQVGGLLTSPLSQVPLSQVNIRFSPLSQVPLSQVPLSQVGNLVDCSKVNCATATLGDAAAAGAIVGTAKLTDLIPYLPDDFTVGDLLVALIDPNTFAYEDLPYGAMGVQAFALTGGNLDYAASFSLSSGGTGSIVRLDVDIPEGALYKRDSSRLENASHSPLPAGEPVQTGSRLRWTLRNLNAGGYRLDFRLGNALKLGPDQATAAVGTLAAPAPAVASITETNEAGDTPTSATPVQTGNVYFGYISRQDDVDFYTIPAPAPGSRIVVRLGNTTGIDSDLVVYSPEGQALRAAAAGVPLQNPPVGDDGIPLDPASTAAQPATLQDVGIRSVAGSTVGGVSATRGTGDETVQAVAGAAGSFTIQVTGYNGRTSDLPYTLRVEETPAPPPPACLPRAFANAGQGTPGVIPGGYNANLNTIFLVNAKRIGDTYGAAAQTSVMNALTSIAARNDLGVSGAVVPVEGNAAAAAAYAAWDANPCSPQLANGVVSAIGTIVDSIRAARPTLKYIVMVGGDDLVPMARVPDNSRVANEQSYASTFAGGANNQLFGSLDARFVLSDQPYADFDPIPVLDRQIFVPDLAIGRLVETPGDIVAALQQFQNFGGVLNPTSALTSGYEFLTDGSQAVAAALATRLGAANSKTLINDTWTSTDLLAQLFPTGAPSPGIASPNAHFDHAHGLPAASSVAKTVNDLFDTSQIPAGRLAGRIWFTMGCHAGLSVPDVLVGSSLGADWAQKLAQEGAVYGANTGYGYGDDAAVAYSERLMALFASHLDGTLKVGDAWMQAIQDYWSSLGTVSVYDEKVMEEATFYGLPFYGVGTAPAPVPLFAGARQSAAAAPVISPLSIDPVTGLESASFTVNPSFDLRHTSRGDYYNGDDGVMAVNYRPLIPITNVDLGIAGKTLHGILVTAPGLSSTDQSPFDPVFSRPIVDFGANEPETAFGDTNFPGSIATVRSFGPPTARKQRGILATGQFFAGDTAASGVMRRWLSIAGRGLYSPSTDYLAPAILTSNAVRVGANVAFTVTTSSDAKFAYVLFRDESGTWRGAYLAEGATGTWSGGAPITGERVEFFVQVGDAFGNIAVSSNKARYFEAQAEPPPPPPPTDERGQITITLAGTTGSAGWYTSPVQVTLASSNSSAMTYSVDHGASTSYGTTFTINGNGFHTIDASGADGSSASAVALIDGTSPGIVITTPAQNADYLIGATVRADYSCIDAGSGAATCTGTTAVGAPIDTATVGPKNFRVDSRDVAGHTSSADHAYRVIWPFSGFFQPISNLPTVNVVNAGSAVPIKFGLGGNRGMSIFAPNFPKSEKVNCNSNAPLDTAVSTVSPGSSTLSYDNGTQTYQYVWKTDKTWANTCRQLQVQLADGTMHIASFKLK